MSEEKPTYQVPSTAPEIVEHKIIPFGHQLVGLDFNPSGDPDVTRVKELAAEMAEIVACELDTPPSVSATVNPLVPSSAIFAAGAVPTPICNASPAGNPLNHVD